MKQKTICVIGDVHGHLQLALCMAARWQKEEQVLFDALFLCGDVGTFTNENQLDSATRSHSKRNECELEFLNQWARSPQPAWLSKIFTPVAEGGLGLCCPVVMVHGNHEGFEYLENLVPGKYPDEPQPIHSLPAVDTGGFIRLLPSGWKTITDSGIVVAGIGGIERGQSRSDYHTMAYIEDEAVVKLLESPASDLLITHQGPACTQKDGGSKTLQILLDYGKASVWCHGHSNLSPDIIQAGPKKTRVVPLGDVAFSGKGLEGDDPGKDGHCLIHFEPDLLIKRERPHFWRQYRKRKWKGMENFGLVCPDLLD